ncbi:MAG: hypothetical protein ETSY1_25330 [Candidatus Entotheonella factor]|uniref:Uncharacterized protein n=1 Tax=Entotheonella factor TaxID=1429438 RepID=W4LGB7_ENTF1|nr:MAG: hypothetical protein ETSY1_25330 [Candidatus Entotheonella factor]
MTEPYMAHTNEPAQDLQQVVAAPQRQGWRGRLQRLVFVVLLTGLCSSMLTGCQEFWDTAADLLRLDGGDAEAQDQTEIRVATFPVNTNGFEIVLDNDTDVTPLHRILDSATEFTMQSEGSLVLGTGESNIALEINDVIILRLNGNTGSATLIRAD